MTYLMQSDARIDHLVFWKSKANGVHFKVVKTIRGSRLEYCFPLRDYPLARDQIVAALTVGGRNSPDDTWGGVEHTIERVVPLLSGRRRPGLQDEGFILPNGNVLGICGWPLFVPSFDGSKPGRFVNDGQIYNWWEEMAELAIGNPLLMLAISFAIAGPAAAFLGIEAPRVQLVGSCIPTLAAIEEVVASMWRRSRIDDVGYVVSWHQPEHVLERIALQRRHTTLVIDDFTPATMGSNASDASSPPGRRELTRGRETATRIVRETSIFSVSSSIIAARARRQRAGLRA